MLLQGAALALASYMPLVNLLVPVLGTGCMVHVLMQRTLSAPRLNARHNAGAGLFPANPTC